MLLLVASVVAVFGQVAGHQWVDFDDYIYLRDNSWLREPLDSAWIRRALLEPHAAYWIPLTWLSYRIDFLLFGAAPGATLLVNVALHALNVLLVYRIFARMTGAEGPSAFVAAAFALHPLHVESVAWASERKDVLSAFFFLAGMGLHARLHSNTRMGGGDAGPAGRVRPALGELAVALCLALGLLAKPMLVTFPLALLILDFWPLGRFLRGEDGLVDLRCAARLVIEKLPLFAMAFGAGLVVLSTQESMGGRSFTADRPLGDRVAHAPIAYVWYFAKSLWPTGLSVFHPLPQAAPDRLASLLAFCALAVVSVLCAREARRRPWLFAGWLWFLIHLAPVIGIVGVGMQAWADRWMYVPLLGLAWIVAWAFEEWAERGRLPGSLRARQRGAAGLATVLLFAWAFASHRQVAVWRDTSTLFRHAIAVDPDNWYAHHRLAVWHRSRGELVEATHHYVESLLARPAQAYTQGELADVLRQQGETALATLLYANVSRTGLHDRSASLRLGRIFLEAGRLDEAVFLLERARAERPDDGAIARELEQARQRRGEDPGKP